MSITLYPSIIKRFSERSKIMKSVDATVDLHKTTWELLGVLIFIFCDQ